jgi:hypothetical protein
MEIEGAEISLLSDDLDGDFNKAIELKFGDTICLSRTVMHPRSGYEDEDSLKMYLAAEGLAQMTAYGVRDLDWRLHSNECLFRVEAYQPSLELKDPSKQEEKKGHMILEELAQTTAFKKCRGQRVHFGQNLQLRHVLSGKLLSLELKHKTGGSGLWKVVVEEQSPNCCVTILPYNNSRQQGEGINFSDGLTLAFEVENLLYYLSATAAHDTWEVAIVNKPSVWRAHLFRDSNVSRDVLSVGMPFMIKKK